MPTERISFLSEGLSLEGVLAHSRSGPPAPGVVICHPHPQFGGSMDNNVVEALFDHCASKGFVTLAFNFRGVGRSQGSYGGGLGERADVRAAVDFLCSLGLTRCTEVGIVGYSFGAWVALQVAVADARIKCAGAVCPPVEMYSFDFLEGYSRPVVLVVGDCDPFCTPAKAREVLALLAGPREYNVFPGEDHFFLRGAGEASAFVCEALSRNLGLS